ncbi:hypothetical protein PILCRDRAFT_819234 [Piloderma croceum F 1598]|uniref:Uncharacterized protein n=1 Tax=Piloderma croceum (strain F 1598) TaxID=765440 RepID=A0A0C3BBF5_PILCF|nr:hypothetical protein PILCRDRAFT_819234 [Piloderma croceum F 1598]
MWAVEFRTGQPMSIHFSRCSIDTSALPVGVTRGFEGNERGCGCLAGGPGIRAGTDLGPVVGFQEDCGRKHCIVGRRSHI